MNENTEAVSAPLPQPEVPPGVVIPPPSAHSTPQFVDELMDEQEEEPDDYEPELPPATSVAQMMTTEIQVAMGDELTPERCDHALAMMTAAREYLLASRRTRFPSQYDSQRENLKKLVEVFGMGAEDNDPAP